MGPSTDISMDRRGHSSRVTAGKRGSSKAAARAMERTVSMRGPEGVRRPMQPRSLLPEERVTKAPRGEVKEGGKGAQRGGRCSRADSMDSRAAANRAPRSSSSNEKFMSRLLRRSIRPFRKP